MTSTTRSAQRGRARAAKEKARADPIQPAPLGVWGGIGGRDPADIRRKIAVEVLACELASHPDMLALFDAWGRKTGLYRASLEYNRARDRLARAMGFEDRLDEYRALREAAKELDARAPDDTRPLPEALLRNMYLDRRTWMRQDDLDHAVWKAAKRRSELLSANWGETKARSPTVKAACRLAVELLRCNQSPSWLAKALSEKLRERFSLAKSALELPVRVYIERPAPHVKITTEPGESAQALLGRLGEATKAVRAALAAARPRSKHAKRRPQGKQASVARNARWLYLHRVERISQSDLARAYCKSERDKGSRRHLKPAHWQHDRTLVRKGIAAAERLLELGLTPEK